MAMHLLSKSSFLKGLQCEKQLYLYKHHYDWADEISEDQQAIFKRGHDVGKLAQDLFPGGMDASFDNPFKKMEQVKLTKELIDKGQSIIYEAAFLYDQVLVIADILVRRKNKWSVYEVKSSTEVKEINISDAAVQYYVISNCRVNVVDISVIHINNKYVRNGELNLKELFTVKSVLVQVQDAQDLVKENIEIFKKVLKQKDIPHINVGTHCSDPYSCSFMGYCWADIPEYSVFNISGLRTNKKFDLYNQGIIKIEDIPDDYPLSSGQRLQVDSHINQQTFIDNQAIREFSDSLSYPLYFLDFETFNPAVPLFDNSRPYQQIPFQYSLHLLESSEKELEHFEFLADASGDPRLPFLESLLEVISNKGDIIVYNQAFESTRLKELAESFPVHSERIENLMSRIKDLMIPFKLKQYYTPDMKGSYSIKAVLPALVPELSYTDLEISEGGTASRAFENLYVEEDADEIQKIREQLLDYCKLDTLAMVKIYEVLKQLV